MQDFRNAGLDKDGSELAEEMEKVESVLAGIEYGLGSTIKGCTGLF